MTEHTSASYFNEYEVTLLPDEGESWDTPTFESLDTDVATINAAGKTLKVSYGMARARVIVPGKGRVINLDHEHHEGVNTYSFVNWTAGSLAREIADAVDDRLSGLTPSEAIDIYDSQDHNTPAYVRNTGCWPNNLDLTCISPWNSDAGVKKGGVLIAPDVIAYATHYSIADGSTVRFVAGDNTVIDRTIAASEVVKDDAGDDTDITVARLNSDVPGSITRCKVFPADIADYLPDISNGLPVLALDQEEKALTRDWFHLGYWLAVFRSPTDVTRLDYYEDLIEGDSGNPAFAIVDDELVLLCTWMSGPGGGGLPFYYYNSNINTAITATGSGYSLTEIDLSSYPTY